MRKICPKCNGAMHKTTDENGHSIWLCSLCGHTTPIISEKNLTDKSTEGSPSFSRGEIKRGYRKWK